MRHEMRADAVAPAKTLRPLQGLAGGLRAALMLLSRLPVGADVSREARRWASAWFPLVGALLGALAGLTQLALAPALGPWLAATCALLVSALLTGALHEDGLADSADALGGARDRAAIFAILKDSRHGTYGVLALVFSALLRVGALARLDTLAPVALVLAAVVARAAMVALLAALPYVTPPAVSRTADVAHAGAAQTTLAILLLAGLLTALVLPGLLPFESVALALLSAALVTAAAGWRFHVRAGGITGDFLGATAQLCEVTVLLALVATPAVG
jgi:adenosylcobinamide-GDP ribazoletransferase